MKNQNLFLVIILTVISIIPAKSQDLNDTTKKNFDSYSRKVGFMLFPHKEKIGIAYSFGKKDRMRLQNDLKFTASTRSFNFVSNETRFLYTWGDHKFIKFYSGLGLLCEKYRNEVVVYDIYLSVTPVGVEIFPLPFAPGLSLNLFVSFNKPDGLEEHFALCYFF